MYSVAAALSSPSCPGEEERERESENEMDGEQAGMRLVEVSQRVSQVEVARQTHKACLRMD